MQDDRLVCVSDFERYVNEHLDLNVLDYIRSGANNEQTLRENTNAFSRFRLRPRFLRDVSRRCLETTVLGNKISFPVGVSPTGMQRMAHPDGEIATAKGAESMGTVMILSTVSTSSFQEIAENAPNLLRWFQLYIYRDRQIAEQLVKSAEKSGFKALVVTIDAPTIGLRLATAINGVSLPKHLRVENIEIVDVKSRGTQAAKNECVLKKFSTLLDPSVTWDDIRWLKTITNLPIVIKGVLTAEDALLSLEYGADAVLVSNHGARQLDGVPATIEVLPEVVKAVNGRCEVYLDGGIRTGTDILKAIALGARAVFVGRPMLWGLVYDGQEGGRRILDILKKELDLAMALSGCTNVGNIEKNLVVRDNFYSRL
ncbi:HAO1 (predicted) [Pycnogonum litorale]